MIKKIRISACTILLLIIPTITFAIEERQNTLLTIVNGYISILHTPENFTFTQTFINNQPVNLYKTLDPSEYTSLLLVEDADLSGKDFNITLTMGNLNDNENVIPFSNISMVSISNDTAGVDTFLPTSPPANTVDLTAPRNCAWDGDLETNCESLLNLYYFSSTPIFFAADPTIPITSSSNIVYVDNISAYFINEIIEFSDGEKALIKNIIQGTGGYLIVDRGILNTTPASHGAGSGITSHGSESDQVVIMDGPEPPGGRIGAYSLGFGFKSLIEPFFEPGNYTGTITYSLYIT